MKQKYTLIFFYTNATPSWSHAVFTVKVVTLEGLKPGPGATFFFLTSFVSKMTFQDRDLFDHSGNDHLLTDGLLLKASGQPLLISTLGGAIGSSVQVSAVLDCQGGLHFLSMPIVTYLWSGVR